MKHIAVVDHPAQLRALEKKSLLKDVELYTFDATLLETPEGKRSKIGFLSERQIISEWEGVNRWAQETALTWFRERRVAEFLTVQGVSLGDSCFHALCYCLVWIAKVILLYERTLKADPQRVPVIFGASSSELQRLLKDYLVSRNISYAPCPVARIKTSAPWNLRDTAKKVLGFFLRFRPCARRADIISSGAISHLATTLKGLKESKGWRICHYALNFRYEEFKICRENGWGYRCGESLFTRTQKLKERKIFSRLVARRAALKNAILEAKVLFFRETDLEAGVDCFMNILYAKAREAVRQVFTFEALIAKVDAPILLLDEDRSFHRPLAQIWSREGKRSYALSHGLPATVFQVSKDIDNAGIADSIVNSQYEKEMYIKRGFCPDKLQVLGVPRFDRILSFRKEEEKREALTLLLCIQRIHVKEMGFLGLHSNLSGKATLDDVSTVLKVAAAQGTRVLIKPHYLENLKPLQAIIARMPGLDVEIARFNDSLYRLMQRSDAVLCGYSTVAIEAMIMRKPVGLLDFRKMPKIHPFDEYGVAKLLTGEKGLEDFILGLKNHDPRIDELLRNQQKHFEYFCGKGDGQNTKRVIDFLAASRTRS